MAKDNVLEVSVSDGKYTVVQRADGWVEALRYGEPWRECVGDNLILALAQELQDARNKIEADKKIMDRLCKLADLSIIRARGELTSEQNAELTNLLIQYDLFKAQLKP